MPLKGVGEKMYTILEEGLPRMEPGISHPDLTASNMIVESGRGILKVVDNELLTRNSYYLIDMLNTYRSFERSGGKVANEYIMRYQACGGNVTSLLTNHSFYVALWHLRVMGSSLEAGSIGYAVELSKKYTQDRVKKHPFIEICEKGFA